MLCIELSFATILLIGGCSEAPVTRIPAPPRDRQATALTPEQTAFLKIEEVGGGGDAPSAAVPARIAYRPQALSSLGAPFSGRITSVLVRPGDHSGSPLASADDLLGAKLLLLEEGHCLRDQALRFCDLNAPQTGERMDVSSLSTLVQMVGAGLGMTLLPQMAVDVETRSAAVSVTRFRPPCPSRTIGMVWRRASPMDGQYLRIAELIRTEAEAIRKRADREDGDPLHL
jgi:hypothetical protein